MTKMNKKKVETQDYCLQDYKNRHYWESIGVFSRQHDGEIMQVYKCSQCQKCKLQKLKEIVRICQ